MGKWLFLVFGLLVGWGQQLAHSQNGEPQLPVAIGAQFCTLFGQANASPADLIVQADQFDCSAERMSGVSDHMWLRADLSDLARSVENPVIRATMSRHGGVMIVAQFDDGSSHAGAYPIGALRDQWRSPNRMSFPIEMPDGAQIKSVLIGVETPWDTENWGEIDLLDASLDQQQHIAGLVRSSLFTGLLLGPILVSVFFFAILRARFLIIHFLVVLSAFLYGVSWSGMAFSVFPNLQVPMRSDFNHFIIPLAILFACLLARELCEREKLPQFWRNGLVAAGGLPLVATLVMLPFGLMATGPSYVAFSLAMMVPPIVIFASLCVASWNGSLMAKLQLLGWSGLGVVFVGNLFHDAGLIGDHFILDHGFYPTLLFEALITSALVTYRVVNIRRERDVAKLERSRFRKLAATDDLTGLANRRSFIRAFERAMETGAHRKTCMALLSIDVDHFKRVNDTYGHSVGDQVLIELARLMNKDCKPGDVCGRLGGEEYSLLISAESSAMAYYRAERLRSLIANHQFAVVETVSVSMGLVCIAPEADADFDQYYNAADVALYAAKAAGRDQVRLSGWRPANTPEAENIGWEKTET